MEQQLFIDDLRQPSTAHEPAREPVHRPTLEIAQGLVPIDSPEHEANAHVAPPEWHPLHERDWAQWGIRKGRSRRHDTIAVLSLPDELVLAFLTVLEERAHRRPAAAASLEAALTLLRAWMASHAPWRMSALADCAQGFKVDRAHARWATRESRTQRFVGLHIDSWESQAIDQRTHAQNRLCINLGASVRVFQFLPLQAADVRASLMDDAGAPAWREAIEHGPDWVRLFLQSRPMTPVIRVRLWPGQAYIAPTENIIHDGGVLGEHTDITFTCRGAIDPTPALTVANAEGLS